MSQSTANLAVADRSVVMLFDQAAEGLEQARLAGTAAERFACARLAALRAAAAVLATRAEPAAGPGGHDRGRAACGFSSRTSPPSWVSGPASLRSARLRA